MDPRETPSSNERSELYITCSIGISYNRLLAKLASGINKPNGVFEITFANRDETLFSCKLSDVCGLGFALERKLLGMGITNFKNLREISEEYLLPGFGPFWTKELKRLSYGEDDSLLTRVGDIPKMKSVSRTFTLYGNTTDLKIIKATLRNLCEEASWKVRLMKMKGREIGVAVKGGEKSEYRHKTLKYFTDDGGDLFKIVWDLFEKMSWRGSVRFLGVWLGMLRPKNGLNLNLFPREDKKENLTTAVDKVNHKYGELTLYPAVMLQGVKIKSEVNGFLGDKGFRFRKYRDKVYNITKMRQVDPQIVYVCLVLPTLFGLVLVAEGLNKILKEKKQGFLSLFLGFAFIGVVVFAYLFLFQGL